MARKKSYNLIIIIPVLILLVLLIGYVYFFIVQQEVFPTIDCEHIPHPFAGHGYSEIVIEDEYVCDADECIIIGEITVVGADQTAAIFNFCPSPNLEFISCTGVDSSVVGLGLHYTENFKLYRDEWVSFTPEYASTELIDEKRIYVQKYDCSGIVSNQSIVLSSDDAYAIGREVKNIEVQLYSSYGITTNVPIDVVLIDTATQETVGSKATMVTGSNGKVVIDCATSGSANCLNYIPTEEQTLLIRAIIDPFGIANIREKEVDVLTGLDLILNCPIQGTINRKVLCQWLLRDATTGDDVSGTPYIEVFQGGEELDFTPIGTNSVEFIPLTTGSADVYVTLNKPDYVSDSDYAQVSINDLEITQFFYIDNLNILSLSSITDGRHTLKFRAEESGEDASIQAIAATITTPSGQLVPLAFKKYADGWRVDYNFKQVGHTYHLEGDVTFTDPDREKMPISYNIITSAAVTAADETTITYIFIGASIGLLIFIIAMIFLFRKKKRRKK